jgi:molybdopterin-guanine dinucleotide biosynthesis protein A
MDGFAAVVLAGGSGRRLGGPAKPTLGVGGEPMLLRVLAAVGAADQRVVVGPPELAPLLPGGVRLTREEPAGGGPVAALGAGLALLDPTVERVAVLAADLPLLSVAAVELLLARFAGDGVVYVDGDGRRQWLCGVWRAEVLRRLTAGDPVGLVGRSLRGLFGDLRVGEVVAPAGAPPPWYDCDTRDELGAAQRMWRNIQ